MQSGNVWGKTDPGRRRTNNEDAWIADASLGFAAVADGMGGAAFGEVASAIALQVLYSNVSMVGPDGPPGVLVDGAHAANASVRSETVFRPECAGMGSTLVAVLWRKPTLHVVNVGDSRCYLFRKRTLLQLSYDQNLGNEMRDEMGWTDEHVAKFPQRSVLTSAIGATPDIAGAGNVHRAAAGRPDPALFRWTLRPGGRRRHCRGSPARAAACRVVDRIDRCGRTRRADRTISRVVLFGDFFSDKRAPRRLKDRVPQKRPSPVRIGGLRALDPRDPNPN